MGGASPTLVLCLLKRRKRQATTTPVPAAEGILQIVTLGVWWDGSSSCWAPSAQGQGQPQSPPASASGVAGALEARCSTQGGAGACPGGGSLSRGAGLEAPRGRGPAPPSRAPRTLLAGAPRSCPAFQCRSRPPAAHRAASSRSLRRSPPALAGPAPPCPAAARPLLPAGPGRPSGCRRGSERRGGAGAQGPAEESGGPGRLPEERPAWMRPGAGSLEQPAPSLPPGALWLEGRAKRVQDEAARPRAGSVGEEGGARRADAAGTRSLSGHSGARRSRDRPALIFPNSPSGRFPRGEGNIGGAPFSSGHPSRRWVRRSSLQHGRAVPCSSVEHRKRAQRAAASRCGSDHLWRALLSPHQSWGPPCARPEFRSPWREKGCSWQLCICAT